MPKPIVPFETFAELDIRVGTVLAVRPAETKKPVWRMTIDFGPDIGERVSCGAYTNYPADRMVGKQVVAVVNFAAKKMGSEISEALVLGIKNPDGQGTILLTVDKMGDQPGPNGAEVF